MKKLGRSTQKLVDEIICDTKWGSTWKTKLDLEFEGDQLINGGFEPYCSQQFDHLAFDIKVSLYNDTYFEVMREKSPTRISDKKTFAWLNDIYLEASSCPDILDRIEMIHAFFLTKTQTHYDTLLLAPLPDHPRFSQQMKAESERFGPHHFMNVLWSEFHQASWAALLAWKFPENAKSRQIDMVQDDYRRVFDVYLSAMTEEDIFDMTISKDSIIDKTLLCWANNFDLERLSKRFGFHDVEHLLIGKPEDRESDQEEKATYLALVKSMSCAETMDILKSMPESAIEAIRERNVLPKTTLMALDWLEPHEKREVLTRDLGI